MKVKDLLSTPEKWCKGDYAQDETGNPVASHDDRAARFCLLGAVNRCYAEDARLEPIRKLADVIHDHTDGTCHITLFNDRPDTTYDDLRAVLEAADI